jgi:hypothetical protein
MVALMMIRKWGMWFDSPRAAWTSKGIAGTTKLSSQAPHSEQSLPNTRSAGGNVEVDLTVGVSTRGEKS